MLHIDQQKSYQFAQNTRTLLRSSQARVSSMLRIDKTAYELILAITWRVAEKISGNKLPR